MIQLAEYLHNRKKANTIPFRLAERVFLKTELDIVYSDLSNWERMDLLYQKTEDDKGNWKKLNYIEYTWVCMVSELLTYGFSYIEIKQIKAMLFDTNGYEKVVEAIRQSNQDDSFVQAINLEIKEIENDPERKEEITNFTYNFLELAITEVILTGDDYHYYLFKNNDILCIPWSKSSISGYEIKGMYDFILDKTKTSHFTLSLSDIVSKFLSRDGTDQVKINPYIVTKEEYTILKTIRKDYKSIKTINIIFADGKIDRMEITTSKKVKVESRLIDHIKKGDYQKITIDTQDGKIVNFENTQKIKL